MMENGVFTARKVEKEDRVWGEEGHDVPRRL